MFICSFMFCPVCICVSACVCVCVCAGSCSKSVQALIQIRKFLVGKCPEWHSLSFHPNAFNASHEFRCSTQSLSRENQGAQDLSVPALSAIKIHKFALTQQTFTLPRMSQRFSSSKPEPMKTLKVRMQTPTGWSLIALGNWKIKAAGHFLKDKVCPFPCLFILVCTAVLAGWIQHCKTSRIALLLWPSILNSDKGRVSHLCM